MAIPAGYVDENKRSAGIAGIDPNASARRENFLRVTRMHTHVRW